MRMAELPRFCNYTQICASNYVTRTSWLIKAAKRLLENERMESTEELLAKIVEKEK